MILKTYDPETLSEKETITEVTSVVFTKRFYRPGAFEIETTSKAFEVGDIFAFKSYSEINAGIVLKIQEDYEKINISGYDLTGVLGFRYFNLNKDYEGTADEIIKEIILDFYGAEADARALPNLQIDEIDSDGESLTFSPGADFLNNILSDFCIKNEIGLSFEFDLENIIFKTKKGTDKTNILKFGRRNKTLSDAEYIYDFFNSYNVGYSIDENEAETVTGDARGFRRRECYSEKNIEDFLAGKQPTEVLNATASEKYRYKTDYELGDYVTIEHNGLYTVKQITEIKEVYEANKKIVVPTFGNEKENPLKKIIESEGVKR